MANLCREAALGPIRDAAPNIQYISADEVSIQPIPFILGDTLVLFEECFTRKTVSFGVTS